MFAFRTGLIWHIAISVMLSVVLYLHYNKQAYKKIIATKDRILMKLLSEDAKKKKKSKA
jgi:hypothetical protein